VVLPGIALVRRECLAERIACRGPVSDIRKRSFVNYQLAETAQYRIFLRTMSEELHRIEWHIIPTSEAGIFRRSMVFNVNF
jgi:hypothetical protein